MTMESKSEHTLYSPEQVFWASFLGTPIWGAVLLRRNFIRMGLETDARKIVWMTLGLLVVLVAAGAYLPSGASIGGLVGVSMGMKTHAQQTQGERFRSFLESGGSKGSSALLALGLILFNVGLVGLALLAAWLPAPPPYHVDAGSGLSVHYDQTGLEAEARKLGGTLASLGFTGSTTSTWHVRYHPTPEGITVGIVVEEGAWDEKASVDYFASLADRLRNGSPGRRVNLQLCDSNWFVMKTVAE